MNLSNVAITAKKSILKVRWPPTLGTADATSRNVPPAAKCTTSTSNNNIRRNSINKKAVLTATRVSLQQTSNYTSQSAIKNQNIVNIAN